MYLCMNILGYVSKKETQMRLLDLEDIREGMTAQRKLL